jgi:hypothetical protein
MANRYWVGGTGTWDTTSTTNWSATSGGASGASAPGAADIALFDANSGAGTVTIGENITVLRLTLTNAATTTIDWNNKVVTLVGNAATIYVGNAAVAMLNNPVISATYAGAAGTRTITAGAGVAEANAVSVNVTAGTDVVTLGTGNNVYRNVDFTGFAGTLNAGNRVFYGGVVYSAALTLAAGAWGTHSFQATSGTHTLTMAGQVFDGAFTFNGAAAWQFTDAFAITAARTITLSNGTIRFAAGTTNSAGAFTFSGSAANQITVASTTPGTQYTLSDASGVNNASYLTVSDSVASGGATWNAYADFENVDAGNNDGWNFGLSPPYETYEPPIIIRSFTQPRRF